MRYRFSISSKTIKFLNSFQANLYHKNDDVVFSKNIERSQY